MGEPRELGVPIARNGGVLQAEAQNQAASHRSEAGRFAR